MNTTFKEWFRDFGDRYIADRMWVSVLFATPLVYFYSDILSTSVQWGFPRLIAGIAIVFGNIFRSLDRLWQALFSLETKNKVLAIIFIPTEILIAIITIILIFKHYVM